MESRSGRSVCCATTRFGDMGWLKSIRCIHGGIPSSSSYLLMTEKVGKRIAEANDEGKMLGKRGVEGLVGWLVACLVGCSYGCGGGGGDSGSMANLIGRVVAEP
ncbi:hypothetical protein M0804_014570 [Polistes exclamans]|nr:hypothetical protein M0804_014571 [Polistes exclamans]KAI4474971.1 hypothetical protein M0804_014570 [Polistes exclamans]